MSTQLQKRNDAESIERLIVQGDLKQLTPEDRLLYYNRLCESLQLNPLTKPFEYLTLNGKLILYARKDATDQLRKIHDVSIQITSRERIDDVYVVTARATNLAGRADESIGAVSIANAKGDALCNALMKAETKAKRRVTLSFCGLGLLDESEVNTIPAVRAVVTEDGEIIETHNGELWQKMEQLSVDYQEEREDMEEPGLARLVIRALFRCIEEMEAVTDSCLFTDSTDSTDSRNARVWILQTQKIRECVVEIIEEEETDFDVEPLKNSRSPVIGKMLGQTLRLKKRPTVKGGKRREWKVTASDLRRLGQAFSVEMPDFLSNIDTKKSSNKSELIRISDGLSITMPARKWPASRVDSI